MTHFLKKINKVLPQCHPYTCPIAECNYVGKNRQTVLRHYTSKHDILKTLLSEALSQSGAITFVQNETIIEVPIIDNSKKWFFDHLDSEQVQEKIEIKINEPEQNQNLLANDQRLIVCREENNNPSNNNAPSFSGFHLDSE